MFDGKHVLIPAKQGVVIIDAALTVKESQLNLRHCNIGDDKFRGEKPSHRQIYMHHYPISCTRTSIGIYCHDFAATTLPFWKPFVNIHHVFTSSQKYSNCSRAAAIIAAVTTTEVTVLWKGIRLTTFKNIYYPEVQKKLQ